MSVSARALDGVYARAATGLPARLERLRNDQWELVGTGQTDAGGKITDWWSAPLGHGAHRIVFETDHYFAGLGMTAAYPEVTVVFQLLDGANTCQIQLMLAPSSYSMHLETCR